MKKLKPSNSNSKLSTFNFQTHISQNQPNQGGRQGSLKSPDAGQKGEKTLARSLSMKQRRSLPTILNIEKSIMNINESQNQKNETLKKVPIYDKKKKFGKTSKHELKVIKNGPELSTLPQPNAPEKQKAFKIKKIQQRSKRVLNDPLEKEALKLDLKNVSQNQSKTKIERNDDVKIIITTEDKLDSRRSFQPKNKQMEIQENKQRRNSHDGAFQSLDQKGLPMAKQSQNDAQIRNFPDNFTSSKNSKRQQIIGEVFDKINDENDEESIDSDERNPPAATSINVPKNDSRYPPKIERFLNLMASQEYDEAEKCLQSFWVESDLLLNQREQPKKQVKFNMQLQQDATILGAAKPPLIQNKLRGNKSKMMRSQGNFKPAESDELQNATDKGNTQQTFKIPGGTETAQSSGGNQFGILNDLLKMAQKQDSKQNPTSNRKLLAYLQQQMLLDQKVQVHAAKSETMKEEKHQIEKEIENDLNYLNVFVAPIGSINIFQQEQEIKQEVDKQESEGDFDSQIRQMILASPLKPIIDDRVLSTISDCLRPSDTPHGGALQLQTEALEQVLSCVMPKPKERSEADQAMERDILKQILPFVESLKEIPLNPKDNQHLRQPSKDDQDDPYLKGIDVATSIASGGLSGKTQDLFDLSRIQEFRKALNILTDKHELTNDKTAEAMTFLTEQFPNNIDDFQREQLDKNLLKTRGRFETRSRVKDVIAQAKKFTDEEQARNQKETQHVASQHQKRKQQIEQMLKRLDSEQKVVKDIGNNYVLSQTLQQKLIYLSFVECTRLIGKHSKSHATLALKAWHQYFNLAQNEVRHIGLVLHQQLQVVTQNIKQLVNTVQQELGKQRIRDMEVLSLKHDYIKTLDLLGILTKNLYQEESRATSYKLRLNTLEDNLKLVYPHCMEYIMQKDNNELPEHRGVESVVVLGDGEVDQKNPLGGLLSKEMRRQIIEKRKNIERQNRQVATFQSQIIYKCGVVSAQDAQSPSESADEPDKEGEQQAQRGGMNYLAALGSQLTGQIEKSMSSKKLEQSTSIYDHLVVDIERILSVIPAKIKAQEKLEAANKLTNHQKVRIQQFERLTSKAEKDIKVLQERCTELQTEIVQEQGKYQLQILTLKKEAEERLEALLKLEQEKALNAHKKKTMDEEVQTMVDAETEQILRQREFNQALIKFRGINKAPRKGIMKLSKAAEEALVKGIPPLENIYLPITDVMQKVKRGGSKYMTEKEIKSVKNVLKMIAGLLQAKIAAMDKDSKDVQALMNIDCFFYHHVQQTYGLQQLADRYCETYLASVEQHRKKDTRIELFRKFVGLDLDRLPYSIFERYVQLIKATGVPISSLFMQNMSTMYVDYSKVRHTFKDLLLDSSLHIQRETYKELKKHTKVVTDNLALLRVLDLEDFEVFKDLQEQTIRSRFKSTAAVLQALFMEAGGDEEDGLVSDDDDEDAKKRIFVTQGHLAEFLMRNFDLNDYTRGQLNLEKGKTVKRVYGMIQSFFIAGQGLNPMKLSLRDLTTGFREKIELRVPAASYFHIAINARVQLENDENAGYAKIYQFYTQLEVEVDEVSGDIAGKDVKIELNLAGMDFQQFVAFLKDSESPLVTDTKRQAAYEIYRNTCEPRQRDRLTCEDFIEAIRKYRLVPPIEVIGPAMKRREIEIAKSIRSDLQSQGLEVPDIIHQAAMANPNAYDTLEEGQELDNDLDKLKGAAGNMKTNSQAQSTRLRDLLALSGTAPLVKKPEEVEKVEEAKSPTPQKPNFNVESSEDSQNSPVRESQAVISSVFEDQSPDITKQSSRNEARETTQAIVSNTADGEQANIIIAGTTPQHLPEAEEKKEIEASEHAPGILQYQAQDNDSLVKKVQLMNAEKEERDKAEQARRTKFDKKEKGSDDSSSEERSVEDRGGYDSEGGEGGSESEER